MIVNAVSRHIKTIISMELAVLHQTTIHDQKSTKLSSFVISRLGRILQDTHDEIIPRVITALNPKQKYLVLYSQTKYRYKHN